MGLPATRYLRSGGSAGARCDVRVDDGYTREHREAKPSSGNVAAMSRRSESPNGCSRLRAVMAEMRLRAAALIVRRGACLAAGSWSRVSAPRDSGGGRPSACADEWANSLAGVLDRVVEQLGVVEDVLEPGRPGRGTDDLARIRAQRAVYATLQDLGSLSAALRLGPPTAPSVPSGCSRGGTAAPRVPR